MEWWSDGVVEGWSDGVMEWWSDGVMEWWGCAHLSQVPFLAFFVLFAVGQLLFSGRKGLFL